MRLPCVVSYRNSTSNHNFVLNVNLLVVVVSYRNSTSNHNAPMPSASGPSVVSYRNSTSNHNYRGKKRVIIALYLIEILHQTTTEPLEMVILWRCILSKFYIKPQLWLTKATHKRVVSYRNSTSNHNECALRLLFELVVSYRNSTSNHNANAAGDMAYRVVSYRNSTSNHNSCLCISEETAVVSYRNSTSNHNVGPHID